MLRIGGDSTDWAWSPMPGMARPAGMRITLDRRWLAVAHALVKDLNARLILGVNLEADNARIAATMAQALVSGVGRPGGARARARQRARAVCELRLVPDRGRASDPRARPQLELPGSIASDFSTIARSLPQAPLAGPSIGSPKWLAQLRLFIAARAATRPRDDSQVPVQAVLRSGAITPAQLLSDAGHEGPR